MGSGEWKVFWKIQFIQLLKQSAISGSAWANSMAYIDSLFQHLKVLVRSTLRKQLPTRSVDVPVSCILLYACCTLRL